MAKKAAQFEVFEMKRDFPVDGQDLVVGGPKQVEVSRRTPVVGVTLKAVEGELFLDAAGVTGAVLYSKDVSGSDKDLEPGESTVMNFPSAGVSVGIRRTA